ncbi:FAD-dependent oxidoreductase [Natrarchaeobius chitinivorans]|uniref:Oxidoreductase n=1 Tax=Natrarchaeobius chitinivorans TaxID=1679083 RepID=A0A3N6MJQ8_NATCH|nr:FAD-dependent monooxygenase [Natrarchaeobius chitinivorans]RQG94456.1 oxidoreductase [Natrarchaeobius chitinivorans]
MTLSTIPRYDPDRVGHVGDRAVVLGGSIAGLCAARVLADGFEEVVVLERDPLPDDPAARDGTPQSSHPHVMLEAGRATLEDFFPGFGERLLSAGGLVIDAATDMRYYEQGDFLANGPTRLPMYCATRALFEHVVRQRLAKFETVEQRGECRFVDYLVDSEGGIDGVTYRADSGGETSLDADLVVDATGRTSRTPAWLEANGYAPPPVDEVTVDVTYGTIRVERRPEARYSLFVPPVPSRPRGGAAIPVEGDRWEVIFQGIHGEAAPRTENEFVAFAESFPVPEFERLVTSREWVSETIHHYPFPSSIRRRFETLDRFPEGLLVTGDAVASFNPVYGQGMSVAALDALILHHALADGRNEKLAPEFFDGIAPVIDAAWKIAVGADFAFPQTTGPKPRGTDVFNRYTSRLVRQAHSDGELTDAFYRVFRLECLPATLLRPGVAWRVLRPNVR